MKKNSFSIFVTNVFTQHNKCIGVHGYFFTNIYVFSKKVACTQQKFLAYLWCRVLILSVIITVTENSLTSTWHFGKCWLPVGWRWVSVFTWTLMVTSHGSPHVHPASTGAGATRCNAQLFLWVPGFYFGSSCYTAGITNWATSTAASCFLGDGGGFVSPKAGSHGGRDGH